MPVKCVLSTLLTSVGNLLWSIDLQINFEIVACVIVGVIIAGLLYWIFINPYNYSEAFTAHGFESVDNDVAINNGQSDLEKTNKINALRKRRKIGKLPPHYPNGWFAILDSEKLKDGDVEEVNVLGENLVAWRGKETSQVFVSNAYCPHLGAHLGVGGVVLGDCIRCPFHHWRYQGCDGKFVGTSNSEEKEGAGGSSLHLKMWRSLECNGQIYVWYHSQGESPTWTPVIVPEIQSRKWRSCGATEFEIACHMQEICENGADIQHLEPLHGYSLSIGGYNIFRTIFDAEWKPNKEKDKSHQAIGTVCTVICFFNKWKLFKTDLTMYLIGPGIVQWNFDTFFGSSVIIQTITPIEPLMNKVRHIVYSSNILQRPMGKILLHLDKNQIAVDMKVWNRKTFLHNPYLGKEDRFIMMFRRWFAQFYSEGKNENTLLITGKA